MTYSYTMDGPDTDRSALHRSLVVGGGTTYVAAWVTGLAVNANGVSGDDSPAVVAAHYATHRGAALAQVLLVHGVAAVALAAFVVGLAALTSDRSGSPSSAIAVAGGLASVISSAQMVLGVVMIMGAGSTTVQSTHSWLIAVERLDAVKLLALAVSSWAAASAIRRVHLATWPATVARAAAVALVVAAIGLAGLAPLAPVAALALVLLLVWVGAVAFAVRRGL